MRRRALLAVAALAAFATMVASCLSPTLPLPPPDQPESISLATNGFWQVSGNCVAGSIVTVFNTKTGILAGVEDLGQTGTYHITIPGTECDLAWVEQETVEGVASAPTEFVLEAFANGQPVDPTACP
jgi:hypothetical protein